MKNKRKNLNIRLQPYEGSLLAEVTDWLNSMSGRDKNEKISDVLVMAYLAHARGARENISDDELVRCCWQTVDSLEKHRANLLNYFQIPDPNWSDRPIENPQILVEADESDEDLEEEVSSPAIFDDGEFDDEFD